MTDKCLTADEKIRFPSATKGDAAYTLTKAGISAIPVIGGPVAEILSAVIAPPLSHRRDEYIRSLAEGLELLQEKVEGFKIENLSTNESFVTTVLQATQVAIRNHQKEKLDALRNAVLNAALGIDIDEDIQCMYLNFIDELMPWHLRLLKFLDDPKEWIAKNQIALPNWNSWEMGFVITAVFPELESRREFYDQMGKDLHSRGLTDVSNFHVTIKSSGFFGQSANNIGGSTTDMGHAFIDYITQPKALDNEFMTRNSK